MKMVMQNIVNLWSRFENKFLKFATRKWYVIDSETNALYSHENTIKFLTKSIESSLCDYSDGNITVEGANNNTKVVFKNCSPFRKCRKEIIDTFIDEA